MTHLNYKLQDQLRTQIKQAEAEDVELQELISVYGHVTERQRAEGAIRNIRAQFPVHVPEGRLMFEIVKGAIVDLFNPFPMNMRAAARYINSDMVHAVLCDVNPEWIRTELKRAHVYVDARATKLRGER